MIILLTNLINAITPSIRQVEMKMISEACIRVGSNAVDRSAIERAQRLNFYDALASMFRPTEVLVCARHSLSGVI
jgi:hypothetical protein